RPHQGTCGAVYRRGVKGGASAGRRAPVAPDGAEGVGEAGGVGGAVAEGGVEHALAERFAEGCAAGGVGGEPAGGGDVVVGRVGDEIGEADGVEEGDADAGGVGAAGERDDGNAHVEGFAGGGGAVVGKG